MYRGDFFMRSFAYDRNRAVDYAKKWALSRNPRYFDFHGIGGDCTNFASQCIYAGAGVMNYTKDYGWYYISPDDRAAAWAGVQYLYRFLTTNEGVGPFGRDVELKDIQLGDVIFLNNGQRLYHTLVVTGFDTDGEILICAHTNDSYMRRLDTYRYYKTYPVHIEKVNIW